MCKKLQGVNLGFFFDPTFFIVRRRRFQGQFKMTSWRFKIGGFKVKFTARFARTRIAYRHILPSFKITFSERILV